MNLHPDDANWTNVYQTDSNFDPPSLSLCATPQVHFIAGASGLVRFRLDELVYALYGLTPEKKALVHAAAK